MVSFQVEPWSEFYLDAAPLFEKHWQDVAIDQDHIKLNVNVEKYAELDASGLLHIVSVRSDGRLVGYYMAFILPQHMHYVDAGPMAFTDVYYLLPEERGSAGAKLMMVAEQTLRARGVVKAYLSCKVHQDHTELFEALGWTLTDKAFTKRLT